MSFGERPSGHLWTNSDSENFSLFSRMISSAETLISEQNSTILSSKADESFPEGHEDASQTFRSFLSGPMRLLPSLGRDKGVLESYTAKYHSV